MAWMRVTQSSSVFDVFAPIVPPVVSAHVGDDDVRAGAGHPLRLAGVEDVRRRQQVQLVRRGNHVDLELVAHPGLFETSGACRRR